MHRHCEGFARGNPNQRRELQKPSVPACRQTGCFVITSLLQEYFLRSRHDRQQKISHKGEIVYILMRGKPAMDCFFRRNDHNG